MDENFFGDDSNQPPITGNIEQPNPVNNQDQEFDFGVPLQATPTMETQHSLHSQKSQGSNQYGSYNNIDTGEAVDQQTAQRIRQEQERIQQNLRQKSNKEYELKKKRKQQGQKQLQQYQQKKQQETVQRRRQNKEKQAKKIEDYKKLNTEAGWKKVAVSVPLKQGQHTGRKDIARMREAIINKRQDQN